MLPALGIGALIGALGAKQRGGNMLTGALTGAALGGIGGMLGGKFGAGAAGSTKGGLFGFGTGWKGALAPAAMIGMGTEMFGQQEANLMAMEGRRRLFKEEEEERLRRLSEIAGYNVADPKHFLTPQSYFSADGGIVNTRQGYYNGGSATLDYTDPDLYTATGEGGGPGSNPIMQLPLGPEGSFTDEFEELDMGSLSPEIQKLYQAFLVANQATEEEVPVEMFMQLMQQQTGRSIGPAGASTVSEDGTRMMEMAARGGRVHAKRGIYLGPDDELEDNERYDEELLDILGEEGAMFHGDYDVADEWKKGGQVNRPGYFLGGLSHLLRKSRAGDMEGALSEMYDKELIDEPMSFEELKKYVEDREDTEDFDTGASGAMTDWLSKEALKGPGAFGTGKAPKFSDLMKLFEGEEMAQGGIADLDMRGGGASFGPGTGTSDDVPAMLSDGEFVMTANAVRNLGGGDRMVGARRMYQMMNQLDPVSQSPGEMNVAGYG